MSDINPYQSPKYYDMDAPEPAEPIEARGVWRQGDLLVMRKGADLPDRCMLTNEPAHGLRVRRKLHWRPPLVHLGILLTLGIGLLLLDPLFGRTVVVEVPTGPQWHAWRRKRIRIAWTLGTVAVCMIVPGVILGLFDCVPAALTPAAKGWMLVGWGLLFLGTFVEASARGVRLTVTRIQGDYVWLRGMNLYYLADLPEWPGE